VRLRQNRREGRGHLSFPLGLTQLRKKRQEDPLPREGKRSAEGPVIDPLEDVENLRLFLPGKEVKRIN